nr:DUF5067 domain-containing protein [Maliibacterium massiliense]
MKRAYALLVCLFSIVLLLCGCGRKDTALISGQLRDGRVAYTGVTYDVDAQQCVNMCLNFTFTNTSDRTLAFLGAVTLTARQGDVLLRRASCTGEAAENLALGVEPGDSQKVAVAFALDDRYAPVQLEIANFPLTEEARPTHPGQLEKIDITLNPAD